MESCVQANCVGAVPYAKTALPVTLLSFESANALWGHCSNPHVPTYSPGGSTGGESALIALGGRIGIGTDVAGSVRVPAAWSGIYSLRCSIGRWPKNGLRTSMPGQEGVPSVCSPMARTLDDLTYFTRAMVGMKPWKYDYTVHPISWREAEESEAKSRKLRIGVMANDGKLVFLWMVHMYIYSQTRRCSSNSCRRACPRYSHRCPHCSWTHCH